MEIKYDLTKNYFKYFNESQGVFIKRNNLKDNTKVTNYITYFIYNIILSIVVYFINVIFLFHKFNILYTLIEFICFILFFLSIFCIINFFCIYMNSKKSIHKGIIKIDEFGITDYSEDKINIGFNWDRIKNIVVSKNCITIIQDSNLPIIIFINIEHIEKLEKAVQKYNKKMNITYLNR